LTALFIGSINKYFKFARSLLTYSPNIVNIGHLEKLQFILLYWRREGMRLKKEQFLEMPYKTLAY